MLQLQSEINLHKAKLNNLTNNLINTQSINEEININNEIKKECEFINSLLNIKQNNLMSQNNLNNNYNLNPFLLQQNSILNDQQMNLNVNQFNFNQHQQKHNNFKNGNTIDILFLHDLTGKLTLISCNPFEKVSELIEKYKYKANYYDKDTYFAFNGKILNKDLNSKLNDFGLTNGSKINVSIHGALKGTQIIKIFYSLYD